MCGMTAGASCIGEYLKENCTLKALNMSDNPIGDIEISQLMKRLQQNINTTIAELYAFNCGISVEGTICNACNTCVSTYLV